MSQIKIITGKGGVGKSAFAAALAQTYARQEKKTLLIELGPTSFFSAVYKKQFNFQPTCLQPNFYIACWSGWQCLKEYFEHLIKLPYLGRLLFDNPVMKHFLQTAPGLKELAIMGKLTSSIRRTGPKMDFEVLVLDAYATGHFLGLIQSPAHMAQLINQGPVGQQGRQIDQILRSHSTQCYILSLAESLVSRESFDLQHRLQKQGFQSHLLANKWLPAVSVPVQAVTGVKDAREAVDLNQFLNHKLAQQKQWLKTYQECPIFKSPPSHFKRDTKNSGSIHSHLDTNNNSARDKKFLDAAATKKWAEKTAPTLPFIFNPDFKSLVQELSDYIYENKTFTI